MTTAFQIAHACATTTVSLDTIAPLDVFARLLAALRRLGPPVQAPAEIRVRVAFELVTDKLADRLAMAVNCAVLAWCGIDIPTMRFDVARAVTGFAPRSPSGVDVTLVAL